MERKNGGGQDARATVVRASCPEPSIANQSANRTVLAGPANKATLATRMAALVPVRIRRENAVVFIGGSIKCSRPNQKTKPPSRIFLN